MNFNYFSHALALNNFHVLPLFVICMVHYDAILKAFVSLFGN